MFNFIPSISSSSIQQNKYASPSNWKKDFLMINVALAIAGIALSVFTKISGALRGSILWVVSVMGIIYLSFEKPYENKLSLLKNQLELERDKVMDLTKTLDSEINSLTEAEESLQERVLALSEDNKLLIDRNKGLGMTIQNLMIENRSLKINCDDLQRKFQCLFQALQDSNARLSRLNK